MFKLPSHLGASYSPLYFLSALGAGGLSISFFIYLMFLTPHPNTPIPTWESLVAAFQVGNPWMQGLIGVSLVGLALFALLHLRLLVWNSVEYLRYQRTDTYQGLRQSNGEVQLMALPLTFAMTINVGFALGAVFVPKLWSVVEYLFPAAILAFAITGFYALKILLRFMARALSTGTFDCSRNNSLSQLLAVFALTMVGVGFSASAAMSQVAVTSGMAMILALMFLSFAALLGMIVLVLGFRGMLQQGVDREAAVSLWIIIPIITLAGIAIYRLLMGMHHNFGTHIEPIYNLAMFTMFVSIQVLFALLGYVVMQRLGYFKDYLYGSAKSIGAFSLVCPGVAAFVMAFFFIHVGLVGSGLVEKFSIVHFVLLAPLVLLQLKTIATLFRLNFKLLKPEPKVSLVEA
ncbi:TsoY family (seleno)protein [Thiolinea disciformis]|uniref:TsoY family (seleno)protein n=1 Tax=Thiolinea disciformis TaxID=125614 RepID=UPI000373C3D7|nr:hypothetical protein [Thiolinea disciformis]